MTEAEFNERLTQCRTAQEIQSLCEQRAVETPGSGVTRDADGILHGSDARVEITGDARREERYAVGTKMISFEGTGEQIRQMKDELLKSGLDISKCRRL